MSRQFYLTENAKYLNISLVKNGKIFIEDTKIFKYYLDLFGQKRQNIEREYNKIQE